MGNILSGNAVVDIVGNMKFKGNIIPEIWYSTILSQNGKPNMNAIIILADIVYWYRPSEVRSKVDGTVSYRKKFADDSFLQRSYQQISDKIGITRRQATSAITFLEKEMGVIKRHFRTVTTAQGAKLPNVMFLELCIERLRDITFIEAISPIRSREETLFNVGHISLERETNTKNITKSTNKEYNNPSVNQEDGGIEEHITLVKKLVPIKELEEMYGYETLHNILSYEHFLKECEESKLTPYEVKVRATEELEYVIDYDYVEKEGGAEMADVLIDYMSEILVTKKQVKIAGVIYDGEYMGTQFYKLNGSAVLYVIDKFNEATRAVQVKNKKNYLLRMLLTARSDSQVGITGDVNYDMAHWNERKVEHVCI